ncbi:MAG TPA: metal-dependent hydrolase [Flavitalea sp.]|nr:metal-dependent hydrolase [Flavitalea sp.]
MDSLTHIALGSCIGEVMLGKKLGRKAIFWGIIGASLPDIDALEGFFLTIPQDLIAHRGITHSFLFALLVSWALAFLCIKLYKKRDVEFWKFYLFFLLQILLHDLLDSCNAYGTGLLEPFSSERFSFNLLYVADPLFSVWTILATLFILFYRMNTRIQKRVATVALALTAIYIGISINNKLLTNGHLTTSLEKKGINPIRYFSTPTPFNNMLWYAVADVDSGYFIGHLSVFDNRKKPVPFNFFRKNQALLDSVENRDEVESLKKFSAGYYTIEKWNDTLVFNVLRFGQMIGWQEPKAHFAFHYFLNPDFNNDLVVQRGRFEGWNKQTLTFMYRRIEGSVEEENDRPQVLPK